MKRFLLFVALIPGVLFAQEGKKTEKFNFPDINMSISVPTEFYVITQDRVTHAAELAAEGVDIAEKQAEFAASGIFLNATVPGFKATYLVNAYNSDETIGIWDFRSFSDEDLAGIITVGEIVEELQSIGVEAQAENNYRVNGTLYYVLSFQHPLEDGGFVYFRQYMTIVSGFAVNIVLNKYDEPITDQEKAVLKAIIDSIVFTKA